ncbi:hypothetical protein PF002_g28544, partial [Phytophthora fragariae]
MRALRTLVLLAAGLTLWAPLAAGDAGASDGPPPAQETAKPRQLPRRLVDVAAKNPRDPFMFDNHMVGDVTVKNHPVYGSASLSVRSGKVYRNIDSVSSPGAVVGARSVPTTRDVRALVNVGDVVFFGQLDARTVLGVSNTTIIIDEGLQHPLTGGESIETRKRAFSTAEDTTLQTAMNARGFHLHSHDDTVNSSSPHKVLQIRHFADASSITARLLPGNVSVVHGSDAVTTLLDLSKELSGSTFVRLAGSSYLVDPVRPPTSTQFFLDRPFAGPSFDDLPIFVDGVGAGILLDVRAGTGVRAGASIDVTATKVNEIIATDVVVSTTSDGVSAGRLRINDAGVQFLGETTTISSEVASINLQPAKDLSLAAGSLDNKPGSKVVIRSGASNWQLGGDIDVRTGQSNYGAASGKLLLHSSDSIAAHASSGSVEIGSGIGKVGPSGLISLSSGNASTGESGDIRLLTGSANGANSGDIALETSTSTGGSGGSIQIVVGAADTGAGGIVEISAGSTTDPLLQGGSVLVNAGSSHNVGGNIELSAADGVTQSGASATGGSIAILSGKGMPGRSGDIKLQTSPSSTTGSLTLASGTSSSGTSGSVSLLTSKASGGAGGSVIVRVGSGDAAVGGDVQIGGGTSVNQQGVGGRVSVQGGNGTTTGGNVQLSAGSGTSALGGSVLISSGSGDGATSGDVTVSSAASGTAQTSTSGSVRLSSGASNGGSSGSVSVSTGASTGGASGSISLSVGSGDAATGGSVSVDGGQSRAVSGKGGLVAVRGGAGTATGGDLTLAGG